MIGVVSAVIYCEVECVDICAGGALLTMGHHAKCIAHRHLGDRSCECCY